MQKLQSRTETRLRGRQSVTGSPRQGANMVSDPSENIVTSPVRPGACLPVSLVINQYVEAEVAPARFCPYISSRIRRFRDVNKA